MRYEVNAVMEDGMAGTSISYSFTDTVLHVLQQPLLHPCANETRKGEEKADNEDTQYKRDEGGKTENAYKEKTLLHI